MTTRLSAVSLAGLLALVASGEARGPAVDLAELDRGLRLIEEGRRRAPRDRWDLLTRGGPHGAPRMADLSPEQTFALLPELAAAHESAARLEPSEAELTPVEAIAADYGPDVGAQADAADSLVGAPRREYPLNCRGGERLVFDTLGSPADTGTALRLSLTFIASPTAAGPEGQGLQPSTCAWVDRPVNDEEPRQVRVTVHISDTTHRATVRDTGMYWSFLAHNSDSGHFTAVGYRYWHASWPPPARTSQAPATAASKGSWLPFNPRHLHWYALGWVVIAWVPILALLGRWSGWRRLAGLYPDRNAGRDRSFRCGSMVIGMSNYRGGARLTADDSQLHFAMGPLLRPGHPPFSVPWSDITASRDGWPWFPFKGKPVIRLTLAKHRALRILLQVSDGERIVEASGGRLELSEPRSAGVQSRETATSSRR